MDSTQPTAPTGRSPDYDLGNSSFPARPLWPMVPIPASADVPDEVAARQRAAMLAPVLPAGAVTRMLQLLDRLLGEQTISARARRYETEHRLDGPAARQMAEAHMAGRVSALLAGLLSGIEEAEEEAVSEMGVRWAIRRAGEMLAELEPPETGEGR